MKKQIFKLYFVSKSKEKFNEIKSILEEKKDKTKKISIEVSWHEVDIPELQTENVEELIKKKALSAFEILHRPLIVEHTALRISAFNDLPGLHTRYFYSQMGYKDIIDYCEYKKNFTATAESILCYCDGQRFLIEKGEEKGIIKKEAGISGFDWDNFFCPLEDNREKKTYAEYGVKKNERSMRKKACEKLRKKIEANLTELPHETSSEHHIKELAHLIKEGKVLLFLGAGISASIGFPAWNKLIEKLGEQNGFEKELFGLYGNNMMLAEYAGCKDKDNIYKFVKQTFSLSDNVNIKDALYKSNIYKALFELDFPVIYTTNYDHLLEEYYEMKKHKYTKVVNIEDMEKMDLYDRSNTRIMKFHGDMDVSDTIVLSESEYFSRMDFQSFMDVQFQSDILHYHVLYLGYSLSDINIKLMLYLAGKRWKNNGVGKKSYIFTATPNKVQETVFEKNGIITIAGEEADKQKATSEFLNKLLDNIV